MKKLLLFVLVIVLFIGGFFIWFETQNKVNKGTIEVFEGASAKQIADLLEKEGVINNSDVFYMYIKMKQLYFEKVKKEPDGFKVLFQAGYFELDAGDFDTLITELNEEGGIDAPGKIITIPEGQSLENIAYIFERNGLFSAEEFFAYAQNPEVYHSLKEKYPWLPELNEEKLYLLEGYLQANTYQFEENSTPEVVVDKLLNETHIWFEKYQKEITSLSMSFDEILTLASIVERESKFKEDRPKVAQVFLNRLEKEMKLESDITAAYANGEHKVFMYYKDIETDSPFNTYVIEGLPIGPICSPSIESLIGVLHPEGKEFNALYFYARPNGETFYATTWQEHDRNRAKWEHEWKDLEREQNNK